MKMQFHLTTGLILRHQMLKSAGPYFTFNSRAIHQGSHLCKGEGKECKVKCSPGQCKTKGKFDLLFMTDINQVLRK